MKQDLKIAVLGAGGRTGGYIVTHLLNRGYSLKILLRNPTNFQPHSPLVKIVKGDAIEEETVHSLLEGCEAVISAVGQRPHEPLVASKATLNILNAMRKLNIMRYISIAGLNVDTPFDKKGVDTRTATQWMKLNFPTFHEDRQKSYSILSTSDMNWTLVRVPFIKFGAEKGNLVVSLEDCPGKEIAADDIANFVVEQLSDHTYFKKAPFISNL